MNKENFRVLIVDDEKSFLLLMTRILEDAGYTVKGAGDPHEALKILGSFVLERFPMRCYAKLKSLLDSFS